MENQKPPTSSTQSRSGAMTVERKPILWFLALTFSLSWILFLVPIPFGPQGSVPRQIATMVFWAVAMWVPGLAAIIVTRWVAKESLRQLNLRRLGKKRAYLWAWLSISPRALTGAWPSPIACSRPAVCSLSRFRTSMCWPGSPHP